MTSVALIQTVQTLCTSTILTIRMKLDFKTNIFHLRTFHPIILIYNTINAHSGDSFIEVVYLKSVRFRV